MSENYQIAPWYNIKEWNEVYENLYGVTATLETKQKALDYLLIWKARCPSLPSGVESTLILLEVYLQDKKGVIQLNSDHLIRLAYSSALMRFVNHMLDTQTAKGQSLFQAAKNSNIPEWIIDMRHDTAHGNRLPPTELLREASMISLEWLKYNYWDKHKEILVDYIVGQINVHRSDGENKIEALINFCVSLSICSHPRCNIKTIADVPDVTLRESLVNDAKDIIGDSFDYSNLTSITIRNLHHSLGPRVNKILSHDSTCTNVNKILLSENSLFLSLELYILLDKYNFQMKKQLNKQFVQCFESLLQFLHTHELIQDFLVELIKKVQRNELLCEKRRKLAALWVSVILKALGKIQQFQEQVLEKASKETSSKIKDIKLLFYHWFPNEKNCHLLLDLHKPVPKDLTNINFIQPIISTYNEYLTYFIKDLFHLVRPQMPQPVIDKLCALAKAISSPRNIETTSRIYTVDDLNVNFGTNVLCETIEIDIDQKDVIEESIETNLDCENEKQFGVWHLASNKHAWSKCPIGQLPWQQIPTEQMPTEKMPTEEMPTEEMPIEQMRTEQMRTEQIPTEQIPTEQMPTEEMPTEEMPTEQMPTEQIPTEPIPTEQMPTEQMPTEQMPTEQIPAGPIPTEQMPTEQMPTEQILTEQIPTEQIPTEEMPTEEMPTEEMPTEEMPTEEMPTEQIPTEQMPTEQMPTEQMPTEQMPTEQIPTEQMPTEQMPTEEMPTEQMPTEQMPTEQIPTEQMDVA